MSISVLIPVYNAAPFVRAALDSVHAQTLQPDEIIVLDDGSEDNSREILRKEKGIRLLESEHKGVSAARNKLLSEASGDLIAFLDADDLWEPEKLARQFAYLEKHPDSEIVFCETDNFLDPSWGEMTARQRELLQSRYPYLLQSALIRRSLFARIGDFRNGLSYGEDTDWFLRVISAGIPLQKIPDVLCHYRIHQTNTMVNLEIKKKDYLKMIATALRQGHMARQTSYPARRESREPPSPSDAVRSKCDTDRRLTISVVIPAYNAEAYLAQALQSVLGQKLPAGVSILELLVVNDGSTDSTAQVAAGLAKVRCIQSQHKGASAARNLGIAQARGDYLLFLDADDVLADDAIQALTTPALSFDGLWPAAVFGLAKDFVSPELDADSCESLVIRKEPYKGFFSGCALIRRDIFSDSCVGLLNESLKTGETVDWLLRFRQKHDLAPGASMTDPVNAKAPLAPVPAEIQRRVSSRYLELSQVTVHRRIHLNNTGRKHAIQERVDYAAILRQRLRNRNKQQR